MEKFLIIDGNNIMNRAFFALPPLQSTEGEMCNAVYGFTNILLKVIKDIQPKYLMVAFDSGRQTFRTELYKEYKAQRTGMADELASQFPIMTDLLEKMGITVIKRKGVEADDVIGTLTKKYNAEFVLLSGDKDLLQLIKEDTTVWMLQKGLANVEKVDIKRLKELMGLRPSQIVDLKSLMGDKSDNIPGVMGIGEKGAMILLNEFSDLENVYNNIDNITSKSMKEKLLNNKDMAFLSKKLATIDTNIPIEQKLEDFTYEYPFNDEVKKIFAKLDFKTFLTRDIFSNNVVEQEPYVRAKTEQISLFDTNDVLPSDEDTKVVEIKSVSEIKDKLKNSKMVAMHNLNFVWNFATNENEQFVLPKNVEDDAEFCDFFKNLCESSNIEKIVFDAKKLKHILYEQNIKLVNYFDVSLAVYIAKGSDISLDFADVMKMNNLSVANCAGNLIKLKNEYLSVLKAQDQLSLYYEIELKLVEVLFEMEINGFAVDKSQIYELSQKYKNESNEISKKIYELVGFEFNINSPKQLSEVLFDNLKIEYKGKKSTGIDVLEAIENKHAIVPLLIRYRKINKLISTYLDGLLPHIKEDGKIHTTFLQTFTSTGRLSSRDPNMQNIPIKDDESRELRKMFVSSFEDGGITSADYNQIELRLMAHLSNDENMKSAFLNKKDIHRSTASQIFGVDETDVTSHMRSVAKRVNFGIIYGISQYG
ncbi:MAG: DNA polymerase I, partial [Clostridia bacterium]|nr:DNA polymerase I [Clostridia bacterium]